MHAKVSEIEMTDHEIDVAILIVNTPKHERDAVLASSKEKIVLSRLATEVINALLGDPPKGMYAKAWIGVVMQEACRQRNHAANV